MMLDLFDAVSTADTGRRAARDFYETPAWMTRALLFHHPAIRGRAVLECAAGRNAITRVLVTEGRCRVVTNDLDPAQPTQWHHDAGKPDLWTAVQGHGIEWVISNLPFGVAFPIMQRAIAQAPNVAMLLRKTFLEPTHERGAWLARHPPTRIIGLPRHKFRGGSSDSVSVDWHIWQRSPDPKLPAIVIDHLAKGRR